MAATAGRLDSREPGTPESGGAASTTGFDLPADHTPRRAVAHPPMSERAAAIVGVGLAGENHLRALSALGVTVAGVLASRQERAEAMAARFRTRAYADLDELLADPAGPIVHVCTPPTSHRAIVEAALAAGRDVLCEKPLAHTSTDANALARLAGTHARWARVAFNRRFDTGVQALREAVAAGELGEPVNVWGSYQQQWNAEPSSFDWRFDPSVIGPSRVVSEIGSHWLDLAVHVLGVRLRRVTAMLSMPRGEREVDPSVAQGPARFVPVNEDAFAALLAFEGGVQGSVFATQLAYGAWDDIVVRVDGTKRSGWWDSRTQNQVSFSDKRRGTVTLGIDSPGRSIEAMLEEAYGLRDTSVAATFEQASHVNAAIDAILASGRGGSRDVEVAAA